MIDIKGLNIQYRQEVIFDNFDWKIEKGEKLAIIGDSGKGKSTLLNLLAGFIPQFTGGVTINHVELSPETILSIRQQIAYLPQDIGLNLNTVEELFYMPFEFELNKSKRPTQKQIIEIFEHFGLSMVLLTKKVNEISGGQKQRILLASCLLLEKEIILLDEPTSALDKSVKEKITDYVLAKKNTTVIAVTHDDYWLSKSTQTLHLK